MTPKEKAKELVHKMYAGFVHDLYTYKAKKCATHAVNEILNLPFKSEKERQYWQDVKIEIERL